MFPTARLSGCGIIEILHTPSIPGRSRLITSRVRAAKGKPTSTPSVPVQPTLPSTDAAPPAGDAAATTAAPEWATAPQQYYYHQQQPMYTYAPPPPPPPPAPSTPFGLPWYAWVGIGILAANIGAKLLQFTNPQKVQEMAMQQMMKQMMSGAGMKPPTGGQQNPFGFPAGFAPPGGSPNPSSPWGPPGGGFPGMTPPVDVTASMQSSPSKPSTQAPNSTSNNGSYGNASNASSAGATTSGTAATSEAAMPPTPTQTASSSFFKDVDQEDSTATTAAPAFNYFEQQAGAQAPTEALDAAAKEEKAAAMLASMEVMMEDPKMVEMMAPYLPEAFRDPVAFKAVLKDPIMRKQVVQQFATMDISFDPSQMQQMMQQYNMGTPEAMAQMQQMGLNPQELLSEMMSDPEIMVLFQNPKIQKAVMEISQNPMALVNYQGDPDVLKVMMKINNIVGPKMGNAQPGQQPVQPVQQ